MRFAWSDLRVTLGSGRRVASPLVRERLIDAAANPVPAWHVPTASEGPGMTDFDDQLASAFLAEAHDQFQSCHRRLAHCLDQLSDEQIWWRADERLNSIGNLLLHVTGNMRQRILSLIGGEPDTRDRDAEFAERRHDSRRELRRRLDDTMRRVDALLQSVDAKRLLETRRYQMLKGEVEGTVLALIAADRGPPGGSHAGDHRLHAHAVGRAVPLSERAGQRPRPAPV